MFDRLFRRPGRVFAAYAIVLPIALWLCFKVPLDSDLLNLLPSDVPAVKSVRKLQRWSGNLAFMYLGIERDDSTSVDDMKRFAEEIGADLRKSKWVRPGMEVGLDFTAIRKAAPLFFDPEDLETIGQRLGAFVKAEQKRKSGFFMDLEEDKPAKFNLDDLMPKYRRRFQWSSPAGAATVGGAAASPAQGPASMLGRATSRMSADGSRLYYLSPDTRMLTFLFDPTFPPEDLTHYPELVADIDAAVALARVKVPSAGSAKLYKGGAYALQWDQRDTTLRDSLRSSVVSAILILGLVFLTVRRAGRGVLVFASLVAGLIVTFGIVYLTIHSVNVITAFMLAILSGLGIDFGLYFATRYNLYSGVGLRKTDAIREAWTQTAVPAAMGALTTLVTLALLAFGRFRGFVDLGIIIAVGIAAIYIAMYTLLPALFMRFLPEVPGRSASVPIEEARRRVAESEVVGASETWDRFSPAGRRAPLVAVMALVVSVAMVVSATRVRFAYTGEELTVKDQQSLAIDRKILDHYGESVDQTVVLCDTEERARRVQAFFEEKFGTFQGVSRYESAFTYVPPAERQAAALQHLGPLRAALERMPKKDPDPDVQFLLSQLRHAANPEPMTIDRLPEHIKTLYLGRDQSGKIAGYLGNIVANHWLWEIDELRSWVNEIESIRVDGEPLELTSRAQIFMNVILIVRRETMIFTALGSLIILFMLWIQMRRLKFALLAMLPLFLGMLWTMGCLPFIGAKGLALSFMNLVVLPALVGMSVSYGVHLVYNYRLYGSADRSLRVTLRPILGSSTTTLVGWASLLLASMIGMRGIGWLATLGMLFTTICSLVVLPAVLTLLDRRGWVQPDRVMVERP